MYSDIKTIIDELLIKINPYEATKNCLSELKLNNGRNILIAIGKASWPMAKAVSDNLDIDFGAVITKYHHSLGDIKNLKIFEAGHPIVDENSIIASEYVLDITKDLNENDNVIFLLSGGGSALFEKPLIDLKSLQDINEQLIKSGADINEINVIRKRLSMVKAGKFAKHLYPSKVYTIILSDVIGNDLSSIASGPTAIDYSDDETALKIIEKYDIKINDEIKKLLEKPQIKDIDNVEYKIIGSVEQLCEYTKDICMRLGYKTTLLENNCKDEARIVGERLSSYALNNDGKKAYIIGGETVVHVKGNGLGGRSSELALAGAKNLKGNKNAVMFAFSSDGTDGPTDAAGGYVDFNTANLIDVDEYLDNNDSYNALKKTGGLIITGPTGSNINDVYVLLIN